MLSLIGAVVIILACTAAFSMIVGFHASAKRLFCWVIVLSLLVSFVQTLWQCFVVMVQELMPGNDAAMGFVSVGIILTVVFGAASYVRFRMHKAKFRRAFPPRPTSLKKRRSQW